MILPTIIVYLALRLSFLPGLWFRPAFEYNTLFLSLETWPRGGGGDKKQFVTTSTDGGKTFSSPIQAQAPGSDSSEGVITAVSTVGH
jgi:hypothetical protein